MPATILGIYVGPTAITWTLVDCHCNVLLWDSIIWQNNSVKYNIINSVNILNLIFQSKKDLLFYLTLISTLGTTFCRTITTIKCLCDRRI